MTDCKYWNAGMKDWDNAWTIGYNNYRDTLVNRLK